MVKTKTKGKTREGWSTSLPPPPPPRKKKNKGKRTKKMVGGGAALTALAVGGAKYALPKLVEHAKTSAGLRTGVQLNLGKLAMRGARYVARRGYEKYVGSDD